MSIESECCRGTASEWVWGSRAHVDEVRAWVREAGFVLLYDERFPFATAPGYDAVFCEDSERIKLEVVAPSED